MDMTDNYDYNLCIVDLSDFQYETDIFDQVSFRMRTMLTVILMEKFKRVISGEPDFD